MEGHLSSRLWTSNTHKDKSNCDVADHLFIIGTLQIVHFSHKPNSGMISPGTIFSNNIHPLSVDNFMWTLFKVFIEFVAILLLLSMFWFSGQGVHGILVPRPRIHPAPCTLEGQALTLGRPRQVLAIFSIKGIFVCLASTPRSANADILLHIFSVDKIQIATFPGYPDN